MGQLENGLAKPDRLDGRIGVQQLNCAWDLQLGQVLHPLLCPSAGIVQVLDKVTDPTIECVGYFNQTRKADPIGAPLIFLHLLETDANGVGQDLLRHAQVFAAQPHALAKGDIEGMGQRVCGEGSCVHGVFDLQASF
jgi:hypothetical protein